MADLAAISMGTLALKFVAQGGPADLIACFRRSCYLRRDQSLVCLGEVSLADGPITIKIPSLPAPMPPLQESVEVASEGIFWAGRQIVDLADATIWRPPTPACIPRAAARRALMTFQAMARLGPDGLPAAKVDDDLARAAARPLACLVLTLRRCLAGEPSSLGDALDLVGLGRGLTPAGDDLLGGVLFGLHAIKEDQIARRLAVEILGRARSATHAISQAHLAAAALGQVAAPLHAWLAAFIDQDPLDMVRRLKPLRNMGHSSGLDALAGLIIVLKVWSGAHLSLECAA